MADRLVGHVPARPLYRHLVLGTEPDRRAHLVSDKYPTLSKPKQSLLLIIIIRAQGVLVLVRFFAYGMSCGPIPFVYCSEVGSVRLRQKVPQINLPPIFLA